MAKRPETPEHEEIGGENLDPIKWMVPRWPEIKHWLWCGASAGVAVVTGLVAALTGTATDKYGATGAVFGAISALSIFLFFVSIYFGRHARGERIKDQQRRLEAWERQIKEYVRDELSEELRGRRHAMASLDTEATIADIDLSALPLVALTPKEIGGAIRATLPLQRNDKSKHYVGLKVRWRCRLEQADKDSENIAILDLSDATEYPETPNSWSEHRPDIMATVDISKHPGIGLLRLGSIIFITGAISSASEYLISLNPTEVEFQVATVGAGASWAAVAQVGRGSGADRVVPGRAAIGFGG